MSIIFFLLPGKKETTSDLSVAPDQNQDLPVALPMFIWYLDPPNLIIATQCLF